MNLKKKKKFFIRLLTGNVYPLRKCMCVLSVYMNVMLRLFVAWKEW